MSYGMQFLGVNGSTFNLDAEYSNYHLVQQGTVASVPSNIGLGWSTCDVTFAVQPEPPLVFIKVAPNVVITGGESDRPVGVSSFRVFVSHNATVEYLVYSRNEPVISASYGLAIYSANSVCTLSADSSYMDIESVIKAATAVPRRFNFPIASDRRFILLNDISLHTIFRIAPSGQYRVTQCAVILDLQNIIVTYLKLSMDSTDWNGEPDENFPADSSYVLNVATVIAPP